MNKRITVFFAAVTFSMGCYSWNEKAAVLDKSKFLSVKAHTHLHTVAQARDVVLIKASGLEVEGKCKSGVFFSSSDDSDAHSLALAAYASRATIQITYDVDQTSPWGSVNYCALTGIEFAE